MEFEKFLEFQNRSRSSQVEVQSDQSAPGVISTPDEVIRNAYLQFTEALADG
jgi:hypothetical protein